MISKQPKITLFTHTNNPTKAVALAVHAWTADWFPTTVCDMDDATAEKLCKQAIKAFHRTALEYVDTVWVIENCSRAFQQQLTRTRLASYAIQSMRVVAKQGFASGGHYTMPPHLNEFERVVFHEHMLELQYRYEGWINSGVPVEDARGILPLNIHSDISMRINLNALYHMLSQRFCVNTQWEYRQVAIQMKQQVEEKLGPIFAEPMGAPCEKMHKCPMREEYCGVRVWKLSNTDQMDLYNKFISHKGDGRNKVITWLNGEVPESVIALKK